MNCPICGVKFNSPDELVAHLKEHAIAVNQDFMNNLMKGMSEVFEKILSGKTGMPFDEEGTQKFDPNLLFRNMMGQLFNILAKSMEGLEDASNDSATQDMPNPFEIMMKNIFDQSFSTESEPESDISSPSTNENDVSFQENSIEIPLSTNDDEKKKKQKENNA